MQEIIAWPSDQSANRTGIESNINFYYDIYGNRLLDLHSGAITAYSVRKLRDNYTGYCMRIRETDGNTLAWIGFDESGNLDTSAIANHCQSASGYVTVWYDQTIYGNHFVQNDAKKQPLIYDGSSVVLGEVGGKPALRIEDASDGLLANSAASAGNLLTRYLRG
jgi:hypothetical protein